MKTLSHRVAVALLCVGMVLFVFSALPLYAQDGGATPAASGAVESTALPVASATASASATDSAANPVTPPQLNTTELLWIVLVTFAFALLAWVILFAYTYVIQSKYYDVTERLARGGTTIETTITGDLNSARSPEVLEAPEKSIGQIRGPDVITLGTLSAEMQALGADGKPVSVKWSIDPPNAALVSPDTGPTTKVFPALAGVLTVNATDLAEPPAVVLPPKKIATLAQMPNRVQLPFIGRGYGAIAIAIVIFAVIIILGLSSVLPPAAIAPLLGTLVGYIFGVSTGDARNNNRENQSDNS